MTTNSTTAEELWFDWDDEHTVSKRSGKPCISSFSEWISVDGLKNSVLLRKGGRIRALIGGSPHTGFRGDLMGEMEYSTIRSFSTVGVDFPTLTEAKQACEKQMLSYGVTDCSKYHLLTPEEHWEMFDHAAQRHFGMSGTEFSRKWDDGGWEDNEAPWVRAVAILRPKC